MLNEKGHRNSTSFLAFLTALKVEHWASFCGGTHAHDVRDINLQKLKPLGHQQPSNQMSRLRVWIICSNLSYLKHVVPHYGAHMMMMIRTIHYECRSL